MAVSGKPLRFVIVGATTLRGKELLDVLKDRFPSAEFKLLDEEISALLLTDAGGEPAVVQHVEEESFEGAHLVFFCGSANFARDRVDAALRDGAKVIDLTGGLRGRADAKLWIPAADAILAASSGIEEVEKLTQTVLNSTSAPAVIASTLAAALSGWKPARMNIVFLQPVSERGREGIEELEKQTAGLLSFQPIAQPVFDAQVAFNVLDGFGENSAVQLESSRGEIARDVAVFLNGRTQAPAIKLLQVPVFHSYAFTAFAELPGAPEPADIEESLTAAGFQFPSDGEARPSVISAAGESQPLMGRVERDPNHWHGYWFWGVVDNLRLSAENAAAIAQQILTIEDEEAS